jgi:hypothetical protein
MLASRSRATAREEVTWRRNRSSSSAEVSNCDGEPERADALP